MRLETLIGARWVPLAVLSLASVSRVRGGAVYAIRRADTRELLYVGGCPDLRRRLFGEFAGGCGDEEAGRMHDLLFDADGGVANVEVAWVESLTPDFEAAVLLGVYRASHASRPPAWNQPSALSVTD